jgi:hypothetical protein
VGLGNRLPPHRVADMNPIWPEDYTGAFFSPCERYRYGLWRSVNLAGAGVAVFVMLNPSTANSTTDDPTIRRCSGFARAWGYRMLRVVNLYALRATHPRELGFADGQRRSLFDAIGQDNDSWIRSAVRDANIVIAAWGNHGYAASRDREVLTLLADRDLRCIGRNKSGSPKHPLYVPKSAQPEAFP